MNILSITSEFGGLVFELEYSYTKRVFFLTPSAISRHCNRGNLDFCLTPLGDFREHAFIFLGKEDIVDCLQCNVYWYLENRENPSEEQILQEKVLRTSIAKIVEQIQE